MTLLVFRLLKYHLNWYYIISIMEKKTLFDKIWEKHLVHEEEGKPTLLYIDLHGISEVSSCQRYTSICVVLDTNLLDKNCISFT